MHAKIGGAKAIFVVLQHTERTFHMSLAGSPNLESRSGNAHLDPIHPLEYLVIDCASTHGTTDIVGRYGVRIGKSVSEKDDGIYSAMLVDRSAYDRVGAFDTSFRCAANHDWAVRALITISAMCLWLVSLLTSGCSGLVYCWQYFPIGNVVYFNTRRKPAAPARNSIYPKSVG